MYNEERVKHFARLNKYFIQKYERYLPTAFDESMTLLEKVNKMIEGLNTIVRHINDQSETLEEWQSDLLSDLDTTLDEYVNELNTLKQTYETFRQQILDDVLPESTSNILNEWLNDGTIQQIINHDIFNDINSQLTQIETLENFELTNRNRKKKPVVAITIDDGGIHDYQTILPLLEERGVRASTGIITDDVGTQNSMTLSQIKELQNVYGWEIVSHARTNVDLTSLSINALDSQLKDSKQYLLDNGLKCWNLFIPQGRSNDLVREYIRKHYRSARTSGMGSSGGRYNTTPLNMYSVDSLFFGDTESGYGNDPISSFPYDTLDFFKYYVDKTFDENGFLVIGLHSNLLYQNNRMEDLRALIVYIQGLGIPIMPYNEALNHYANIVDTHDFKVGADGKIGGKYGKIKMGELNDIVNDTTFSEIEEGYVSVNTISTGASSGVPSSRGGTIVSVKPDNDAERTFSLFKGYGENGNIHYKNYDENGLSTDWQMLNNVHVHKAFPSTHTATDLFNNKINVSTITAAYTSGYPEEKQGLLIAPKLTEHNGMIREEYIVSDSAKTYIRYWDFTGSKWTPWRLQLETTTLPYNSVTLTDSINEYPKGVSYLTINAGYSNDNGFPEGSAGTLETHNVFTAGYAWQYFHVVNSTTTYKRVYKSDNTWSDFVLKY